MAKVKRVKESTKKIESPFKNYWSSKNTLFFVIGLAVMLIGFILMNQYPWDNPLSMSYSAWVLLAAYLIVFPISIFYKGRKSDQ